MMTPRSSHSAARENLFPVFNLRLSQGQSIGPLELRRIWKEACGVCEVSVARTERSGSFLYSLSAPQRLLHTSFVEQRLRSLLAESLPNATIALTHY
jgi:hypothetical protein